MTPNTSFKGSRERNPNNQQSCVDRHLELAGTSSLVGIDLDGRDVYVGACTVSNDHRWSLESPLGRKEDQA